MSDDDDLLSELIPNHKISSEIKDEAELLTGRFCELIPRTEYLKLQEQIPMYEYNRPIDMVWSKVYECLRLKGFTQKEAICWMQSKSLRWTLDGVDINTPISEIAMNITEQATIKDLEYPLELWTPETIEDYRKLKPDVLVIIENHNTHVYSNQPDSINKVVVCFDKKDDRYIEIVSPKNISGKSDDWVTALWGNDPRLTPDKFYKQFMINNT